jgi:predicted  nucleic acid-binding Zn-ribbon protein
MAPESSKAETSEDSDLMAKTKELIEHTRREILRLQEDIQSARTTIDRSQGLLSRAGPPSERR